MLVVLIVSCILWWDLTMMFRITSFWNYSRILTHYMSWWNLTISLFVSKHIWWNLAFCVMMRTVRSLLFFTLLVDLIFWLLVCLLLLLHLLELLMSSEHSFYIIARHGTWAWISITVYIAMDSVCKLRTVIVMRWW